MKKQTLLASLMLVAATSFAQTQTLPKPNMQRQTLSVMETFQQRKSVRAYSPQQLSEQDLSDLLWAASGVNRENGNLTAPTAMNRQEIRLYVFTDKGVSLYDPKTHTLSHVVDGDHRDIVAGPQDFAKTAPTVLLMVADMEKFGSTNEHAQAMVAVDTGIMSENINIFCSAAGLCTVTRAMMNQDAIRSLLNFTDKQIPIINNPVGYPKK